jgi:hypothetical protein
MPVLSASDLKKVGFSNALFSSPAQPEHERRLRSAHIRRFKPLADFDWDWPKRCDRATVRALMTLSFMTDAINVVLVGPNGVGKSMLACNLGHQALIEGKTVLFATAGQLLGDLAALDSDATLRRRIRHCAAPDLLLIGEMGYLSYSNRHADLLFELISRHYEHKGPSLPPTGPSRNGARCSPTRPAPSRGHRRARLPRCGPITAPRIECGVAGPPAHRAPWACR